MSSPDVPDDLAERKAAVKNTLRCPYCDSKLEKFDVSQAPVGGWGEGILYVCMSDDCSYYRGSYETLAKQGLAGGAYRFLYDPEKDWCGPVATRSFPSHRTPSG